MENHWTCSGKLFKQDNLPLSKMTEHEKELAVFQGKKIRRIWHNDEWHFSVIDVVSALTDSVDARDYWYRLKQREKESSGIELSTFCRQLELTDAGKIARL